MKRIVCFVAMLVLAAVPVWAGEGHGHGDQEAMMAEMANCHVCKNMLPHLAELGPVMGGEVVKLSNGVAVIHTVSDPGKVELLQQVGTKMGMACASAAEMSDADAKGSLCTICTDVRAAIVAGADMGGGPTKTGDIFVLTSSDPKVQAKIAQVGEKFAMMMASH